MTQIGSTVLFGGLALVMLGLVLFRWRMVHRGSKIRKVLMLTLVVLAVASPAWQATTALGVAALVITSGVAIERIVYAEMRSKIRSGEISHLPDRR